MDNQHVAEPTDADLAKAWALGDERAYDALVARHAPVVFSYCRRTLGEADADDATQAVFLVLARKRDQAAASPAFIAWLMTVALNVVRNAWRERQRRRDAESSVPPPPPPPSSEESNMQGIQVHLDACLAELPVKEREAVMLHHLAGCTLAEVSKQTKSGLSTVRYRIERGLERLRTLLAARGVVLSSLAVAACLATEAQAAVPTNVLSHLHDLTQAGGGTGSTTVPSARALRWSKQKSSTMTRIAIAAAGLLLIGGSVAHYLSSAETGTAPPVKTTSSLPVKSGSSQATASSRNPLLDLDPEHAHRWGIMRANNGARTAARLREQPEMALLSAGQTEWIDAVASVREAVTFSDMDSLLSEEVNAQMYRRQKELAAMTPAQRQEARARYASENKSSSKTALPPKRPRTTKEPRFMTSAFSGWIVGTAADAQGLVLVRSLLGDPQPSVSNASWLYATTPGDARMTAAGNRITIEAPTPAIPVPAAIAALAQASVNASADIEFAWVLDSGRPGTPPIPEISGSLEIRSDGLRLNMMLDPTVDGQADELTLSQLDKERLATVPAAAVFAVATVLHRDKEHGGHIVGILKAAVNTTASMKRKSGLPNTVAARSPLEGCEQLLKRIDGTMLAWIEPGAPFPMVTVEADMTAADAAAVIDAAGLSADADGIAMTMAGPVAVTIGWRNGHLIATTNPGGLDAIDRRGGFTAHPEIQRSLAAMPSGDIAECALLRPINALDMAAPYVGMVKPEMKGQLADYRARLDKTKSYAFISSSVVGTHMRLDASGIFAIIGAGVLASQMNIGHAAN
ncbi:MAG: sigma-70 family RNA polymerase sigma factor [Planctomycetota bacterium]